MAHVTLSTGSKESTLYPFGMGMPNRTWSLGSGYRYGFNDKEKDNETNGTGNEYDYGFRVYDPRISRFFSVDPLSAKYPFYTPYQYSGNKPIAFKDIDGGEEKYFMIYINESTGLSEFKKVEVDHTLLGDALGQHIYVSYQGTYYYLGDPPPAFLQSLGADNMKEVWKDELVGRTKEELDVFFKNRETVPQMRARAEKEMADMNEEVIMSAVLGVAVSKCMGLKVETEEKPVGGFSPFEEPVQMSGHLTPWETMSAEEKAAFQHSYSRHGEELGLPNWQQTKAASLQSLFNSKVTAIRTAGAGSFFDSKELVDGVVITVRRTEPTIAGQKYYYYETKEGKFISAGKMNK